jgi:glycosyltransferase involved in cell wall biosynthesis
MTDPPGLALVGGILARRWRCRHVHWCQDLYPDIVFPDFGELWRRFFFNHDFVIVPGPCLKQRLNNDDKIFIVPNWPEKDIMPLVMPSTLHPLPILYSGNFGWAADMSGLLGAWRLLNNQRPGRVKLHLCGRGRRRNYWQKMAPSAQWSDPVAPSALSAHLGAAALHVVVQSKKTKGCLVPIKFMAAMAAGRPVLALVPANSSVAKWVIAGKLGWVVDPNDEKAIVDTMITILDNPGLLAIRGVKARQWFVDQQIAAGPQRLASMITGWFRA